MSNSLQEHFDRYLRACQDGDYQAMLPFMDAEVVKSMGGKAKFLQAMAAVSKAMRANEDARRVFQETSLEKIGPVQSSGSSHKLAFVQVRVPLFIEGKKILETVTPVIALSKDGEHRFQSPASLEDRVPGDAAAHR